jgi:hypothetical protein
VTTPTDPPPAPGPIITIPREPNGPSIWEARRLRDQFAVEAFKKLFWNEDGQPPRSEETRERLARDSWLIADAMLKARGQ